MVEIFGQAEPRFSAVKDVFAGHFSASAPEERQELGARFTLTLDGETVVDLWAGHADRERTRPFDERTLAPVFSTTKAVAATMIARLVDQGKLSYDQTVASLWPAFGQAGKEAVTVGQAISHQAGLSGFAEPMDPEEWFDWDAICDRLAAMAPLWPPGTASGYHPTTVGYLVGEIFRRADGRPIAEALREDLCEPAGLDIWIGLPADLDDRLAEVQRPRRLPDFGERNAPTKAAFLNGWSAAGGRHQAEWRRLPVPSSNGHATALALARLMGALAGDGRLGPVEVLSPAMIAEASRERIRGQDLVLPYVMSWAAGFMRNEIEKPWGPGLRTFGHSGWGGACAFADPERRLGGAYVMNRQSPMLLGDVRPKALIEAAYGAL